ncbi:MAG: DUF1552 domain-containing protein [Planctomycetota bacterium]
MIPNPVNRRTLLKGVSAGLGGVLLAPLLQKVAAAAEGNVTPPKRVIFFVFDNGFQDDGAVPLDTPFASNEIRQFSLRGLRLPLDIEPFAPFMDRMTLLHGLRTHGAVDHGGLFHSLSGSAGSKYTPQDESIDAALARGASTVVPLLHLGVGSGQSTAYCCSAWGRGQPIAAVCSPRQAYESLFGSVGATRNDFSAQRNLLDFVTNDIRQLRSAVAGPERELVDAHLGAMESLTRRDERLASQFEAGALQRHAPNLPERPTGRFTDTVAEQCDIAAAALVSGLTNVVSISVGLNVVPGSYSGFTNTGPHGLGHGSGDQALGFTRPFEPLAHLRNFHARQAARLLTKLKETPEGNGTMFDNTLLVFMSDTANQQHCWRGANWPFVLVGNLGGTLTSGQYLSYPVSRRQTWDNAGVAMGAADEGNPVTNALYATLLHAVGKPRDTFNRSSSARDVPALYGPLRELLA